MLWLSPLGSTTFNTHERITKQLRRWQVQLWLLMGTWIQMIQGERPLHAKVRNIKIVHYSDLILEKNAHQILTIITQYYYYYYYYHQCSSSWWSCRGIWSWRALCGGTYPCPSSSENRGSNQDPLHHNLSHGSHGLARRGIYIYIKLFER